jgi:hypothetical protein
MRPYGLLAALLLQAGAFAQWMPATQGDLEQRIRKNRSLYEAVGAFGLDYTIAVYRDASSVVAEQVMKAHVESAKGCSWSGQPGMLTVQDADLRVLVDSAQRVVMVSAPTHDEAYLGTAFSERVLAGVKAIGTMRTSEGEVYRVLFNEAAAIDAMEVTFDDKGWLRRVTIHWRRMAADDPRARMGFVAPRLETRFGIPQRLPADRTVLARMDTKRLVQVSENGVRPLGALSTYELIDTRLP